MMVNVTSKIKKPKISKDQKTGKKIKRSKEDRKKMDTSTTQCSVHTFDA
jgi:hypothetical protein